MRPRWSPHSTLTVRNTLYTWGISSWSRVKIRVRAAPLSWPLAATVVSGVLLMLGVERVIIRQQIHGANHTHLE